MKKQRLVYLFLFVFPLTVSAQTATDKAVASIHKAYDAVSTQVKQVETDDEQGEFGPLIMNELAINARDHQWRAVGKYRQTYRFFYKGGESEQHLYPDQIVLIKNASQISDKAGSEEYFFDNAGRLIYHRQNYVNDETGPTVREVYFSLLQKPMRILENGKVRDKLSPLDVDVARDILKTAEKLKEIFDRTINI